jgi:2-polyprenyl-3-methyl-5-hydroxy-6-metoxy-1,4-benzoquinol methylase
MKAVSITHQHTLAVITAECSRFDSGETIRVLDAGCGNGLMVQYLQTMLPEIAPQYRWEVFGYDVADHGVQENPEFISAAVKQLKDVLPEIPWEQRISTISVNEPWPYKNGAFHVIVSNQVVEHVNKPEPFFSEIHRCLDENGFSSHIFPLKTTFHEGHINVPYAHRVR